jgi:hypothetical protein
MSDGGVAPSLIKPGEQDYEQEQVTTAQAVLPPN